MTTKRVTSTRGLAWLCNDVFVASSIASILLAWTGQGEGKGARQSEDTRQKATRLCPNHSGSSKQSPLYSQCNQQTYNTRKAGWGLACCPLVEEEDREEKAKKGVVFELVLLAHHERERRLLTRPRAQVLASSRVY